MFVTPDSEARQKFRPPPPFVEAVRAIDVITIGANLSERVWQRAGIAALLQRDPDQGKPATNVSISLILLNSCYRTAARWVTNVDDPAAVATFGSRYIFADLDQEEITAGIRLDSTFTPKMSLPPASTVSDPDFNFNSLRGSAVLRWEYMPGSTIYFVWTQQRTDDSDPGNCWFGGGFPPSDAIATGQRVHDQDDVLGEPVAQPVPILRREMEEYVHRQWTHTGRSTLGRPLNHTFGRLTTRNSNTTSFHA